MLRRMRWRPKRAWQDRRNGVAISQPPSKRLRPLFATCQDVTRAADMAALKAGAAEVNTQRQFERTLFMRGVNTLKAAWVVAGEGHWEVSAVCARQLFELVLNMEYIAKDESRESASFQFTLFGLLQNMQSDLAEVEYARDTGRPFNQGMIDAIEHNLALPVFDVFRTKKKDGSTAWQWTWNGKTAYGLAKESPSPLRLLQYEILFKRWSEEAHAAPGALTNTMFRIGKDETWFEKAVADDDREIIDVLKMAVTLFLQLWRLVSDSVPYDAAAARDWMGRMAAIVEKRYGHGFAESRYPRPQ